MAKNRQYVWCLIEFTNGEQQWYCVSTVLREAILQEREVNPYWKNTMIGNYLTVSTRRYINGRAPLTVGKIKRISVSNHRTRGTNWTRNQFVTPEHLMNFRSAYNYLRHDYSWYNHFAIWMALKYWHNELKQVQIRKTKRRIKQLRWKTRLIAKKARERQNGSKQ